MRKYFVIGFLLIFSLLTAAEKSTHADFTWNKPEVYSRSEISFLTGFPDAEKLFEIKDDPADSSWHFALYPLKNISQSCRDYFSVEKKSDFINYNFIDKDHQGYIRLNILAGIEFTSSLTDSSYYFPYRGLQLQASIRNRLFFSGNWWAGYFQHDLPYAVKDSPILDSWTQKSDDGKKLRIDNLSGMITYRNNWSNITLGRGKHIIGNNIGGSIILNDDANDYGYFSGECNFGNFELSFLHATLIPDSLQALPKTYADKYLVTHQLLWRPSHKLSFFVGEHVIYANRSIDPSYLLPHTFYRITEHNLRDRDNVLIFAGYTLKCSDHYLLYGNLILDELAKNKLFSNWWGNKYALQLGQIFYFKASQDNYLGIEITAVRPWLYTHNLMENKFSHDGVGLGFPGGSNLIQFTGEINLKIRPDISLNLNSSYIRQGSTGNHFSLNYDQRPSENAEWLDGEISSITNFNFSFTWVPLSAHNFKTGIVLTRNENLDLSKKIFFCYQTIY